MFGKKRQKKIKARLEKAETENSEQAQRAGQLVQGALDAVDKALIAKKVAREKAARFIGSLRPAMRPAHR